MLLTAVRQINAANKTLREGRAFPLLWQHNPSLPIGSVQISDSDVGLQVDGRLVLEDPQARIALAHLKAQTIKGLSIGFDTIKDAVENGVRHLKELRLWVATSSNFSRCCSTMYDKKPDGMPRLKDSGLWRSQLLRSNEGGSEESRGVAYALKGLASDDYELDGQLLDEHQLVRHRRASSGSPIGKETAAARTQ